MSTWYKTGDEEIEIDFLNGTVEIQVDYDGDGTVICLTFKQIEDIYEEIKNVSANKR